jgi:hypothetical protein
VIGKYGLPPGQAPPERPLCDVKIIAKHVHDLGEGWDKEQTQGSMIQSEEWKRIEPEVRVTQTR